MQFSAHTQIPFTSKLHNLKGKSMCRSLVVLHQCIRIVFPSGHLKVQQLSGQGFQSLSLISSFIFIDIVKQDMRLVLHIACWEHNHLRLCMVGWMVEHTHGHMQLSLVLNKHTPVVGS